MPKHTTLRAEGLAKHLKLHHQHCVLDITDDEIERSINEDALNDIPIASVSCHTHNPTSKKNDQTGDGRPTVQSLWPH